jgi:hypothetical protein
MKKLLIATIIVLVLAFGIAAVAMAITNGQPDGDNHPYVGLLVFDYAPGAPGWRCSGALIAPNVVLTAGHCTDGAVAARVWFGEDVTYDAVPFPLYPYGGPGSGAIEGTPYTNPDFCIGCGNGLPGFAIRDVGIVVLDEPVYMDEYAALPTSSKRCGSASARLGTAGWPPPPALPPGPLSPAAPAAPAARSAPGPARS